MNKIIAVPTRTDRRVDDHFGHCAQFTLFSVSEQKEVREAGIVLSLPGCGCKSNIASVLRQKGVSVLLAGNMGSGAVDVLKRQGIEVHRGCAGNAAKAVEAFVAGEWKDSGVGCSVHGTEAGHQCPSHPM